MTYKNIFQELDDTMSEIKKRANHVRTNLKTMELAIEEQEKLDKSRYVTSGCKLIQDTCVTSKYSLP